MLRGRSTTRLHSNEPDIESAESELAKLQRQVRVMEGNHQACTFQTREQIRKQQKEIEMLLKEQKEQRRNLGVSESVSCQQQDIEDTQHLHTLLSHGDALEEEQRTEKQCQRDLRREISNCELKLAEVRRVEITMSGRKKPQAQGMQRVIRILENSLNRASTSFNQHLTKNSHLRDELKTLQIERVHFQQLYHKLDKELQDLRKKTAEMISLSTATYDARVESQSKMSMMMEKEAKDLAKYNTEVKELEDNIAYERNLKEFMTIKCRKRTCQDDSHETRHQQLSKLKEKRRVDLGEESPEALEEMFEKIKSMTEEDNLDMLVNSFIKVEDINFALFNFVKEQNNEAEALMDRIKQIQEEMEQLRVEGQHQEQEERTSLRDIDERQKITESQAMEYESQAGIVTNVLDLIKTGVNNLFSEIECDRSMIEDMFDSSAGISENNIMSYLSLVEQKTNELLTIQAYLSSKDMEKDYNPKDMAMFLLGQDPDMLEQNISIQPAISSVEYDTDSLVTEDRPLSYGELRQRLMKGVLQQEDS